MANSHTDIKVVTRSNYSTAMAQNMNMRIDLASLAGPSGSEIAGAMSAARAFLKGRTTSDLLASVGQSIADVPTCRHVDKSVIQDSYYGGTLDETDDLLAGLGPFYVTEQRKVFLDCTAGHYQMTWGYEHPTLMAALADGIEQGIVWDNHSNIPQWPVKRLAQRLVEIANPDCPELHQGDFSRIVESDDRLNTVLIGVCTGSVAGEAAVKIMLMHYGKAKPSEGPPVLVALDGNYHGTGMFSQRLRGMWPDLLHNIEFVAVQPNDRDELEATFAQYGQRVAGFWAEPIMMNREVILVDHEYLCLARQLCDGAGALMAVDEIQTGFWMPGVLMFKQYGITPDLVVVGKGLTAGFHPLSGLIYRGKLDILAQYDAISTNGGAALAAYIALANLALLDDQQPRIQALHEHYFGALSQLAAEFPKRIAAVHGKGLLTGLKFRDRDDAIAFHKECLSNGLWLRVHAYYEDHSTLLMKFALCVDEEIVDWFVARLRELMKRNP